MLRERRPRIPEPGRPSTGTLWKQVQEYIIALVFVAVVTSVLSFFRESFTQGHIYLLYVVAVLAIAIRLGTGPTFLAAIASFLSSNFFFIEPVHTFIVTKAQFTDLCIFLIVALLVSQLGAYSRRQGDIAYRRAAEQELLHSISSSFNQIPDREGVDTTLRRVIQDRLGAREVSIHPAGREPAREDFRLVTSHLELSAADKIYGTVHATFDQALSSEQSRLLAACVVQASMALQRIDLTEQAQRSFGFEEADRLKTALLHAVSHDLRTPITIIKTSANNLRRLQARLTEEERLDTLEGIERAADHLNTMVGNLLDLSRLEAGVMPINRDWYALPDIASDVAGRMWELYRDERIRLLFPPDIPLVSCDFGLMLQALGNVMENALRFEPAGSVIEVLGSHAPTEVRVAVIGHGASIPPGQREAIMEPFNRQEDGHLGLGLAISKGIVAAHHGRLWVEDTPGGGATFVIALPLDLLEERVHADPGSR
jgi:two-component system, OmpR family, sensor histidine kinase KdpD